MIRKAKRIAGLFSHYWVDDWWIQDLRELNGLWRACTWQDRRGHADFASFWQAYRQVILWRREWVASRCGIVWC